MTDRENSPAYAALPRSARRVFSAIQAAIMNGRCRLPKPERASHPVRHEIFGIPDFLGGRCALCHCCSHRGAAK
jgi:hypothetical protein